MNIRYVCDAHNPIFKEWLKGKPGRDKKYDMEIEKLKLENERLNKEKAEMWNKLWADLQEAGVIPAHFARENFGMSYNPETGQLFIEPDGHGRGPMGGIMEMPKGLIEMLTGGGEGQQTKPPRGVH